MSRISFENYGVMAEKEKSFTSAAGRHEFQEKNEKMIIQDLIPKMNIGINDSCLEIGCGTGNLLIPLSFFCKTITGIDHSSCIEKLEKRIKGLNNIKCIEGNFFDVTINDKFDKIIIYSVLHYLEDIHEIMKFIFKALEYLNPGGKLLLGDIPNNSKRERFNNSEFGIEFQKEWDKELKEYYNLNDKKMEISLQKDEKVVQFNDEVVLDILLKTRKEGYNSYVIHQKDGLPFNYTREDILIEKLK